MFTLFCLFFSTTAECVTTLARYGERKSDKIFCLALGVKIYAFRGFQLSQLYNLSNMLHVTLLNKRLECFMNIHIFLWVLLLIFVATTRKKGEEMKIHGGMDEYFNVQYNFIWGNLTTAHCSQVGENILNSHKGMPHESHWLLTDFISDCRSFCNILKSHNPIIIKFLQGYVCFKQNYNFYALSTT